MVNLIVDVSRYLMILLIAVYTWLNFRYFSFRDEGKQKKICGRQNRCMFLIHFLAYGILWLKTEDERILAFYVAQVVFFLCYIYVYRLFYHNVSRLLVNNMCMLLSVGFIILTRLSFDRALKQFVIVLAAAVITWIIPFIMDRVWQLSKIPWVYGILGLLLLGVVLITGISSYGAQLSIGIGGFTFQPSEFVKISFVFFVATMFYRSTKFKTVCMTTLVAALHVLILVASKDLGSALIFFVTYVLMLFVATGKWVYLLGGAGAGARLRCWPISSSIMSGRGCLPGEIHGRILKIRDTRLPSPFSPSVRAGGSAWDSARECQGRYRWWKRTLYFPPFRRNWEESLPCAFCSSASDAFCSL